ncbi:MAG: hypothetical protein WC382_07370 [Methanoregulaceae archaeon]
MRRNPNPVPVDPIRRQPIQDAGARPYSCPGLTLVAEHIGPGCFTGMSGHAFSMGRNLI